MAKILSEGWNGDIIIHHKKKNMINNIEEEICAGEKKFLEFKKEINLSKRIESVRQELYNVMNYSDHIALDCEVIKISQYLDELLIEYLKNNVNNKENNNVNNKDKK